MAQHACCLTVGGSDSCGGAGIQADLRVFESIGVHGCSATTALTAQNPRHITHIEASPLPHFEAEISAITDFYAIRSIKTGMLYDEKHLQALLALKISLMPDALLIVDPVLIASSGKHLFQGEHVKDTYVPLIAVADIWTPNLQEAAFFLERPMDDPVEMASTLLLAYQTPVLLKGGHANGDTLRDVFCDLDGSVEIFEHVKQHMHLSQSHGTGCRLASAIAAYLAEGEALPRAVAKAEDWLQFDLLTN